MHGSDAFRHTWDTVKRACVDDKATAVSTVYSIAEVSVILRLDAERSDDEKALARVSVRVSHAPVPTRVITERETVLEVGETDLHGGRAW